MKIMIGDNDNGWEEVVFDLHDRDGEYAGTSYTNIQQYIADGGDICTVMETIKSDLAMKLLDLQKRNQ